MHHLLTDPAAKSFNDQWMFYDYWQRADNPAIRIDAKYDTGNVRIEDRLLKMQQLGYTDADQQAGKHISMSGLQSRRLDIIHGTFRTTFKVRGADGGSCASFFWYRDDATELDIEAVTKGTSLVNNTINYTTQPSLYPDGTRIPNATLSVPLAEEYNTNIESFHEHRFDCGLKGGARFYLDGNLMQVDGHNIPKLGGSLQLKLWADGNKWWSGHPSSSTVTMSVKSVIAYFNISGTEDGTSEWFDICAKAGGPSKETICEAYAKPGMDDNLPIAASGVQPTLPTATPQDPHGGSTASQHPMDDSELGTNQCWAAGTSRVGPCDSKKSQAARTRPAGLALLSQYAKGTMSRLITITASAKRHLGYFRDDGKSKTNKCLVAYCPNLDDLGCSQPKYVEVPCDSKTSKATRPRLATLASLRQYVTGVVSRFMTSLNSVKKYLTRRSQSEVGEERCCGPFTSRRVSQYRISSTAACSLAWSADRPESTEVSVTNADRHVDHPESEKRESGRHCWPCTKDTSQGTRNTPTAIEGLLGLLSTTSSSRQARLNVVMSDPQNGSIPQASKEDAESWNYDPLGYWCAHLRHRSQGARAQPFDVTRWYSQVTTTWNSLTARFPPASSKPLAFAPKNSSMDSTILCRENDTILASCSPPKSTDLAHDEQKSHAVRTTPLTPYSRWSVWSQKAIGGGRGRGGGGPCYGCFAGGSQSGTSQATRNLPPGFATLHRLFGKVNHSLSSRDDRDYSLPFGSPVEYGDEEKPANETTPAKSQAGRVQAPAWFNTMYNTNSSRISYRGLRKVSEDSAMPASQHTSEPTDGTSQQAHACQQRRLRQCSLGSVWDFGQWSRCLSERSAWCTFFSGSSFLLMNGIIQVLSVPLIFAWLFYMTET